MDQYGLLKFIDDIIDELVEAKTLIIYDRSSDEEAALIALDMKRNKLRGEARKLIFN